MVFSYKISNEFLSGISSEYLILKNLIRRNYYILRDTYYTYLLIHLNIYIRKALLYVYRSEKTLQRIFKHNIFPMVSETCISWEH